MGDVVPIESNGELYEKLVFDSKKKEFIKFLVEKYLELDGGYNDLTAGKGSTSRRHDDATLIHIMIGQSLVLLLSGDIGTGKTLMAEARRSPSQTAFWYY